jgi:HPt (histidine-containing phosphotransfer) domain-containing protein
MIDWARIAQLYEEVGGEDFAEIVGLFLEEAEGVVARLSGAPDLGKLGEDLHFLKGSALNLGFEEFGKLCQAGEKLASGGQARQVELAPILECFRASRQLFLASEAARRVA